MFTGIIETIGELSHIEKKSGDLTVNIQAKDWDWQDVKLGDSIACNGVCLTVVALGAQGFSADVSAETLNFTTLGGWQIGLPVNLEKALTPQSRMGGHIVSGHVDGIGEVVKRESEARSERFTVSVPAALAKYIAHKGSITIDGTSLTVNWVDGNLFDINIVPHTLNQTIIGSYRVGTRVNLEVDVLARYLERLLLGDKSAEPGASVHGGTITTELLANNGFLK